MVRVNKEKAAKTAEFLFRYMVARYRCVGGSLSSGRIRLASEIRGGLQVFEGAGAQIVERHYRVTLRNQATRQVRSDKSRSPGQKDAFKFKSHHSSFDRDLSHAARQYSSECLHARFRFARF